ncbi:MAG: hypothetical protein PSV40_18875 [Polaromonas sp.]|uniref:hypothetical protein n=1 Tax=Polaromonas sp. TaxID=1869339 RepID=UPI0024899348|nr:hypothetical protein [Polaromonas sp.]MDI1271154.1 hypothetical protein [Polaromonas sp.]
MTTPFSNYPRCSASLLPLFAALLLAGGAALAQDNTPVPGPRINRNPEFRQNLPPAPPVEPDPRDSTTRPVQPAEQPPADGRSVVLPLPGPQAPASAPALPASGTPGR